MLSPMQEPTPQRPRTVVVGVHLPGVTDGEQASSLDEIARLAKTLGLDVVTRVTQKRTSLAAAAVVGEGKLHELASWTGGSGVVPSGAQTPRKKNVEPAERVERPTEAPDGGPLATVIVVDHDLTPSQARNMERATGAEVLDRTAVILEIFHRHARTREARAQVEMARLVYMAPRLRESGRANERQRGGAGVKAKGAGESSLELDRRKIRDRMAELREELRAIEHESRTRRRRRGTELSAVALVGYTNAGKSSLMRGLTGSDVHVADKLFATLDTTVRALHPEARPGILVSDTVGFIKKLPHGLVASFRSTLEQARDADLLVQVVDASDPAFRAQMEVTGSVLEELGAGDAPRLVALNKIDRLSPPEREALAAEHPDAILLSARDPADVAALRARIVEHFERDMVEDELVVPYAQARLVSEVHASCRVLSESHDELGTHVRVRAPSEVLARLRTAL